MHKSCRFLAILVLAVVRILTSAVPMATIPIALADAPGASPSGTSEAPYPPRTLLAVTRLYSDVPNLAIGSLPAKQFPKLVTWKGYGPEEDGFLTITPGLVIPEAVVGPVEWTIGSLQGRSLRFDTWVYLSRDVPKNPNPNYMDPTFTNPVPINAAIDGWVHTIWGWLPTTVTKPAESGDPIANRPENAVGAKVFSNPRGGQFAIYPVHLSTPPVGEAGYCARVCTLSEVIVDAIKAGQAGNWRIQIISKDKRGNTYVAADLAGNAWLVWKVTNPLTAPEKQRLYMVYIKDSKLYAVR